MITTKLVKLNSNGEIEIIDYKELYNLDDKISLSKWCRELIKCRKDLIEFPNLSSGLKIKETNNKILDGSVGCIVTMSDKIIDNSFTCILSGFFGNHGVSITKENLIRCLISLTVKKCITSNWINCEDEYMMPDVNNQKFKQFSNDCIVFSLFNSSSQQTSLRNIEYHNKKWNIKNEFFWLSKETIKNLSEFHNNEFTYNDIIQNGQTERYLYTLLNTNLNDSNEPFSNQSRVVLNKAYQLVINTFPYRKEFNNEHPEYQINNWDCGWYQIKELCKKYLEKEYEEFRKEYLKFRDELRPLVYELGFLKE